MVFRTNNYLTDYEDTGAEEPAGITSIPVQQPAAQPYGRAAINQNYLTMLNSPPAAPAPAPTPAPVAQPAPTQSFQPDQSSGLFGLPFAPAPQPVAQPVQPVQPVQPAVPDIINNLSGQILGQGLTSKWSGEGFGSAEKNAADMARILAGIGITDINQFGRITKTIPGYSYETEQGTVDVPEQTITTFGNKLTGQEVPNTYSERQKGDFFGGTFTGKGNTGYGVQFDEKGNPLFYTQGASSADKDLGKVLALAQFVPGLGPVAQGLSALMAAKSGNILGAISGAAGLGGLSDISNAANFAGAVKSGNPMSMISSGANLGGVDLGGIVDASGVKDLTKVGDYDITDAFKAAQAAKAIKSGDLASIISTIGEYTKGPSQPEEMPVPIDFTPFPEENPTSRFADRATPEITEDVTPGEIEAPNPIDLLPELPKAAEPPKAPEAKSDEPFSSAFARARASGEKTFEWNGKPYTTDLAPTKPTYDSVGGGRGGQGGATAEELAAYNRSQAPISVVKPKTASDLFTSMFPSAEAGTLPGKKESDLVSQIPTNSPARTLAPGERYDVPASTYDQNNSIFGRVADELGLPQEFQRNVSNTLNALPGVNLPFGAIRNLNSLTRGVGAADELGASKFFDEAGRYIQGSNAYKAPEYASDATRLTADPMKMFKMIEALPNDVYQTSAVQNALKSIAGGDSVAAFRSLESNPAAKKALLDYAQKIGAKEVSPFQNINLFNPAEYLSNTSGKLVGNPATRGGKAEGGLASLKGGR